MSPRNWEICPNCGALRDKKISEKQKEVDALYGKIPAQEYLKRKAELNFESEEGLDNTLRENYRLGFEEGVFKFRYKASCDKCGFTFEVEQTKKIET